MNKLFLTFAFVLGTMFSVYSQSFEGVVKYKIQFLNPDPNKVTQASLDAQTLPSVGEAGYALLKYYYKGNYYKSESIEGNVESFQLYDPINKLVYDWQKNSNQASTDDTTISDNEILGIKYLTGKETVIGIACNMLVISTNEETIKLWYNDKYLKMDATLYSDHKSGNLDFILKKIGCIPLKMEQKGNMTHVVQTVLEIIPQNVDNSVFVLPTFSSVTSN